jgi:hypothetical protein
MPRPACQQVVPYRKSLFYPFHNPRQFQPVLGTNKKREQVIRETKPPYFEGEAFFCLTEHLVEKRQGLRQVEQWFPVIDSRVDFIPHILFKRPQWSHTIYKGLSCVPLRKTVK